MQITKILLALFLVAGLSSCLRGPDYYASLNEEVYPKGVLLFSEGVTLNQVEFSDLSLREDGACSITENRNGRDFRGGGSWSKTKDSDIFRIGLTSNSFMSYYRFYVKVDEKNGLFYLSEKIDNLNE